MIQINEDKLAAFIADSKPPKCEDYFKSEILKSFKTVPTLVDGIYEDKPLEIEVKKIEIERKRKYYRTKLQKFFNISPRFDIGYEVFYKINIYNDISEATYKKIPTALAGKNCGNKVIFVND